MTRKRYCGGVVWLGNWGISSPYVANKIGVDKVAMGSDFDGATITSYDITGFPLIVNSLLKKGFSRRDIEKIMGGNVRDFMLRNLPF